MIKTTGKAFKQFFHDPWPDGWILEDEYLKLKANNIAFSFDDTDEIPDEAIVEIINGSIFNEADEKYVCTLTTMFKNWQKKQTHKTFVVECPNELEAMLREWINANGGKVLT